LPPERFLHAPYTCAADRPLRLRVARIVIKLLTMKRPPWQIRMTLWIAVVGPPVASLILMTATYFPFLARRAAPVDVSDLVVLFIFFAVPIGYVFGVLPALLAGALYGGVLTAMATRRFGMLPRVCLAAFCGGGVCGVWFHVVAGPNWRDYGAAAALAAALLSLRWPQARTSNLALRQPERLTPSGHRPLTYAARTGSTAERATTAAWPRHGHSRRMESNAHRRLPR
jgi:hypothetical protein